MSIKLLDSLIVHALEHRNRSAIALFKPCLQFESITLLSISLCPVISDKIQGVLNGKQTANTVNSLILL